MWNAGEARKRTDQYRSKSGERAREGWLEALELYENEAHKLLEYSGWGEYWEGEMDQTGARGHQILEAARVTRILTQSSVFDWEKGEMPSNERQAHELVTLKERPEDMVKAWTGALKRAAKTKKGRMTAAIVKRAVEALDEKWALADQASDEVRHILSLRNRLIEPVGEPEDEPNEDELARFDKAVDAIESLAGQMKAFRSGQSDIDEGLTKLLEGEFDVGDS